jgi:hypothetical protein
MSHPRKASLSIPRRRLLEWMQQLNFGHFEGLQLRAGKPVLDPAPRVYRDVKLGGENGPRPESSARDFVLRESVVELFREFDRIDDGVVARLEVKHGLPFRLVIQGNGGGPPA